MLLNKTLIKQGIINRLDIDTKVNIQNEDIVEIRLSNYSDLHTFMIKIKLYYASIDIELIPDNFAGETIRQMGLAKKDQKELFYKTTVHLKENNYITTFNINNQTTDIDNWSNNWEQIDLILRKDNLQFNEGDINLIIVDGACSIFSLILCLFEVDYTRNITSYSEGSQMTITVNKYERNPRNRALCILHHGYKCKVCNFEFNEKYGNLGDNFIEVHHLTPLSEIKENHIVNPVNDLIPLCSNCHSMIHRNDQLMSPEDLKFIIDKIEKNY